ncbi:MAG: AAA family ATPase [Succinivibrio sp.]
MSHQGFLVPKSQIDCSKALEQEFRFGECFVILSGESGSGRTSLCEQVVTVLENRYSTVFVPCQDEMTVEQLRQLFLQQVAPNDRWDDSESLCQSFSKLTIPVRQRILVVIDDIDLVVSSFFEEIVALYEQNLGKNRLSFLLTAHPLWTQSKISAFVTDKLQIKEIVIPRLSTQEALSVTEQMFTYANLDRVYKAILPKLPSKLEKCEGNISRIIKLTETLMNDPIEVNEDKKTQIAQSSKIEGEKKKKGAAGSIFISAICIVIVLACLVPVFLGSNIVEKFFSGKDIQSSPQTEVKSSGDNLGFGEEKNDAPLSVSAGAVNDISATGPKGDALNAVEDDGKLLPSVEGGIEVESDKATTKNSVTLEGDALDKIENNEADAKSDDPRRGLAGSVENSKDKNETKELPKESQPEQAEIPVLVRSDSILYKDRIAKEDADTVAKRKLEDENLAKIRVEQEKLIKAQADELAKLQEQQASSEKKALESENKEAVTAKIQKTEKSEKNGDRIKSVPRAKTNPVPGDHNELLSKNGKHYTLQVQAGRNRAPLLRTADYVDGRYWIYTTKRDGAPWYVLIMGDFLTPKEAVAKASILPANIRKAGPFAKSFAKVQSEMRLE